MLTKEEMQKPRTPKELEQYFWNVYDNAKSEERKVGRLKEGLWGCFFHELSVLRIHCNWKFPNNDVSIKYIIGNQGYDAIITDLSSTFHNYTEYVEITFPIMGGKEKQEAYSINKCGYSIEISDIMYNENDLRKCFIKTAEKKSLKDYNYPNSSLIFAVDVFPLSYFKNNKENYKVILPFVEHLRKFKFNVKSVYLVLFNANQSSLDKKVFVVSEG